MDQPNARIENLLRIIADELFIARGDRNNEESQNEYWVKDWRPALEKKIANRRADIDM